MSRPPAPSPIHPPNHPHTTTQMAMAETQNLLQFPPPPYFGDPYRRLPQPVQLPPLSVPREPVRPDFPHFFSPPQRLLPSISSLSSSTAAPAPPRPERSRPQTRSAAPVEHLLSADPYSSPPPTAPPPSLPYSRPISPRSQPEAKIHPPCSLVHYADESRPVHYLESAYPPQANPPPPPPPPPHQASQRRQTYQPLSSPIHPSSYPPSNSSYRGSIDPHGGSAASLYTPGATFSEPVAPPSAQRTHPPPPPPAASLAPATTVGPGIVPNTPYRGPQPDKTQYEYRLIVRQQPVAARACGFGERDRRVIDPPPIIQLLVTDPKTGQSDPDELRYSLNVVHCTLWNADGTNEETALVQPDRRTTRRLMGQLVASPSVAKDEHDVEGCFFCFPDLSCRTHGQYRLRFVLMRIDPMNLHVGGLMPILTEVLSDVFTVYTAKDFPGMRPSSALTRALKLQGCNIQVKKGNEKALARRRASHISDEDDHGGNDSPSERKRRRE